MAVSVNWGGPFKGVLGSLEGNLGLLQRGFGVDARLGLELI